MVAINRSRGHELAARVARADCASSRMRGLLGRGALEPGEALWIEPCSMIHTWGMRFAIDVLFLDRSLKVVRVVENMRPWRVSPWVLGARSALELAAGSLGGRTFPGDRVEIQ